MNGYHSIEFPCDFIQSSNDSAIPIRVPTIMQPSVVRSHCVTRGAFSQCKFGNSPRIGVLKFGAFSIINAITVLGFDHTTRGFAQRSYGILRILAKI